MDTSGIIFLAFTLVATNVFCASTNLLDRKCLNCFCQGQTGCDTTFRCVNRSLILCGPYKLSRAYWLDGGSLGNNDPSREFENFVECSLSMPCAEQTIQNYMNVYAVGKDCNGNDRVDCVDYFRIHKGGPGGCKGTGFESTIEWLRFLECYLNTSWNVSDAYVSAGIRK